MSLLPKSNQNPENMCLMSSLSVGDQETFNTFINKSISLKLFSKLCTNSGIVKNCLAWMKLKGIAGCSDLGTE